MVTPVERSIWAGEDDYPDYVLPLAKTDAVEAKYKNGVLTITIPKAEQQERQSHKIEIK